MQKWVVNILVFGACSLMEARAATPAQALQQADSLHSAKQYTQAFKLYVSIYESGHYTPAMLLRMAYIEEGLGRLGPCLYYLNLYFLASHDTQALKKMEELAEKNNLEGYKTDESARLMAWLQDHYNTIALLLASLCLLLLAFFYYQRVHRRISPAFTGGAFLLALTALLAHANFSLQEEHGIVSQPQTYLMSGPSAGASIVAIIGEGNQLPIQGKKDVWLRVRWREQEAWVKENLIREVRL